MGSVCSCFHVDDLEEQRRQDTFVFGQCTSICFLTTEILHVFSTLLRRRDVQPVPLSDQVAAAATQVAVDSTCDTYRSPPRPLPYDDPRCSPLQRDGLISRHGKASSHCHEISNSLGRSCDDYDTNSVGTGDKWGGFDYDGGSKLQFPESSVKKTTGEVMPGILYTFTSSEDEDVCPICLEEYTLENPMITMQCFHDFHLGCIYEWMERSDACPICGKVMVFDESA